VENEDRMVKLVPEAHREWKVEVVREEATYISCNFATMFATVAVCAS